MSPGHGPDNERLSDLLADRAVQGLSSEEAAELERLLAATPGVDIDAFDRAAAAVDAAFAESRFDHLAMPEALRRRMETAAAERFATAVHRHPGGRDAASAPRRRAGLARGLAFAAVLAIAAIGWWRALTPGASSPMDVRQVVLAAPDRVQWTWAPWPAKPAAEGGVEFPAKSVTGEVTWSTAGQAGVMRFVGLPRNNPGEYQYQLWIIDPGQKHPIDGGVFNVGADGEVLVAIDPKIRVGSAAAFAITAEKPGGVVVSEQGKRVVIAAAPAGKG